MALCPGTPSSSKEPKEEKQARPDTPSSANTFQNPFQMYSGSGYPQQPYYSVPKGVTGPISTVTKNEKTLKKNDTWDSSDSRFSYNSDSSHVREKGLSINEDDSEVGLSQP